MNNNVVDEVLAAACLRTLTVKMTAITETHEPLAVLQSIARLLGTSIRTCVDAGQISEEQGRDILRMAAEHATESGAK